MAAGTIVALYATLLLPRSVVRPMTHEDGPFEYLGALGLAVAAALFAAGYVRLRRADPTGATGIWKRRSLLVLALVFVVGAGEEVSWGQRLLGVGTPEDLADANVQGETNVHNLKPVAGMSYQLFLVGWYGFVLVVPLAAALSRRARRLLDRLVPLVPLPLGALFLLNYVVSQFALFTVPLLDGDQALAIEAAQVVQGALGDVGALVLAAVYPINRSPLGEVQELVVSLLAVLTAWIVLKRLPEPSPARGASREAEARSLAD
jgi:hypothetical protein